MKEQMIPKAERTERLFAMAASLRREGDGFDDILDALREANAEMCQQPLPDDELRAMACRAAAMPIPPPAEPVKELHRDYAAI